MPITESEHFRLASDGVFEWDGTPPPGDLSPAQLRLPRALAEAPSLQFNVQTGGGVYGDFYFDGDQSKIELVFSAEDADGIHLYNNSKKDHDWRNCSGIVGFGRCSNSLESESQPLNLFQYQCGVSVEVGGTGWARKSLPFGITIGATVLRYIGINAPNTWGEASIPIPADFDTAPYCQGNPGSDGGTGGGYGDPPLWSSYEPPQVTTYTVCTMWWEVEIEYRNNPGDPLVGIIKLINYWVTCS